MLVKFLLEINFSTYSIPVTLYILFAIIIAWFFQDKVSSSNMPRKLNKCTRLICMISMEIFMFLFVFLSYGIPLTSFYLYLKTIYLVLATNLPYLIRCYFQFAYDFDQNLPN